MCARLTIDEEHRITCAADLAVYLKVPVGELAFQTSYDRDHVIQLDGKCCLCPINLGTTADKFGYWVEWESGDTTWTRVE